MIQVVCPSCSKRGFASDDTAGQPVNCPKCDALIHVPGRLTVAPDMVAITWPAANLFWSITWRVLLYGGILAGILAAVANTMHGIKVSVPMP